MSQNNEALLMLICDYGNAVASMIDASGRREEDEASRLSAIVDSRLAAIREALSHRPEGEAVFWYRPVGSDGGYEGPIHDSVIEQVRKESGAWVPLYQEAPAAAGVVPECPDCNGSGTITVMTHGFGPDDYDAPVDCPTCEGTGGKSAKVCSLTGLQVAGSLARKDERLRSQVGMDAEPMADDAALSTARKEYRIASIEDADAGDGSDAMPYAAPADLSGGDAK
ncbi:MAG: zinc finger-like domain-containing protein [Burkholderiales bacterium]|nr:zinc finger-like domain-containing protein [Burkholderiales bacterium]